MNESDECVRRRVRNLRRSFRDQLSLRDERTRGVWVQPDLGVAISEDVAGGSLLQPLLGGRPVDGFARLFDPIERDGLDDDGVHDAKSTETYDYGVERGVILNESHVGDLFAGIGYPVGRFDAVDDGQAVRSKVATDDGHRADHTCKRRKCDSAAVCACTRDSDYVEA